MNRLENLRQLEPWEWPEEAKSQILEVLRDEKAGEAELMLAVELGGNEVVVDDELAGVLLSLVSTKQKPEKVRAAAAISLGPALETADTEGFDFPEDIPISERRFNEIREALHAAYDDADAPKEVRRRVLEGSVRAPQAWQQAAIRAAWASGDPQWKLTAVFCMNYVRGFDDEILQALESADPQLHYEAVVAAGGSEVDGAWDHVAALVRSRQTPKALRLAAIEACPVIRPFEAKELLEDFLEDEEEDIVAAVEEALAMAEGLSGDSDADRDADEDDEEGGANGDGGGSKLYH